MANWFSRRDEVRSVMLFFPQQMNDRLTVVWLFC